MDQTGSDVKSALALIRGDVAAGHVLRDVADRIGVAQSTLSRWLAGERDPTGQAKRTLLQWARARDATLQPPDAVTLAYWAGRAEQVAHHLAAVLEEQRQMVAAMRGADRTIDADAVRQAAKAAPVRLRQKAESTRLGTDQEAPNTARLRVGSDSE
jgi:transcriptional regulator with XRE-family HTH domain